MKTQLIDQLLRENNGYIKTSEALRNNISKPTFLKYVKENELIKVAHGLYKTEDSWIDDFYVFQYRYPKIVFSHETAAYLFRMSSREPFELSVTLETGKSSSRLNKSGLKVYKIKGELFEFGLTEVLTPYGNTVRSYDLERTFCDLVRSRNNIEIQEVQTFIQAYFKNKDKNIPQLMKYAKLFSIEKTIRQYTDVLLT